MNAKFLQFHRIRSAVLVVAKVAVVIVVCGWGPAGLVAGATISGTVTVTGAEGSSPDLTRIVVYLNPAPGLNDEPAQGQAAPQIAQKGKAFVPNFLVIARGETVEFPNFDPFSHNVFSRSAAAQFDLERYSQGESKSVTFKNAGVVQIFCNIHPQMRAVLVVTPTHYFTRADAQGHFALDGVPPGRFVLAGWESRAGEQTQTVDVPAQGVHDVRFTFAAAAQRTEKSEAWTPVAPGVERGLGVKRERLNLPVVGDAHQAPK